MRDTIESMDNDDDFQIDDDDLMEQQFVICLIERELAEMTASKCLDLISRFNNKSNLFNAFRYFTLVLSFTKNSTHCNQSASIFGLSD